MYTHTIYIKEKPKLKKWFEINILQSSEVWLPTKTNLSNQCHQVK